MNLVFRLLASFPSPAFRAGPGPWLCGIGERGGPLVLRHASPLEGFSVLPEHRLPVVPLGLNIKVCQQQADDVLQHHALGRQVHPPDGDAAGWIGAGKGNGQRPMDVQVRGDHITYARRVPLVDDNFSLIEVQYLVGVVGGMNLVRAALVVVGERDDAVFVVDPEEEIPVPSSRAQRDDIPRLPARCVAAPEDLGARHALDRPAESIDERLECGLRGPAGQRE